jgi:hypothetical protein
LKRTISRASPRDGCADGAPVDAWTQLPARGAITAAANNNKPISFMGDSLKCGRVRVVAVSDLKSARFGSRQVTDPQGFTSIIEPASMYLNQAA